ncbi:MAG TPA: mandelate racemase/muconate lactonizing enzyme family protein [Burkholderiales bacterium]|nr:mandelate racemase/muconate lactonizing enzyme family protein [Burkholderiales bacterium]
MSIARVQTDHYRIELPVTVSDSTHGQMSHFELITVRVHDTDGAQGTGYTYTVGCNGAAIHATVARDFAPLLQGQRADLIEALWQKLWWASHYGGRGGAAAMSIAAVDIALWDLKARKLGVPLWTLLGGHDARVPCYAGGIDLHFTLERLLAQTDDNLKKGFRAIKMKVGRHRLSEDVARVQAMREHLGADFPLMVDANMRWTPDEAVRAARAMRAFDVYWLEEPTIPDDVEGHARVVREGGLPVATGENLHTLYEFKRMIAAGAVTFPEPDVTVCGGVTGFIKVARLAEAFNLPVTSHGAHDITVHLLAAAPNRSYLEAHGFGLDRYIAHPLQIADGFAVAPDRPGHGVEFDWGGLERCRT